ncbi:hypothetical protein [Microbulbifer elongatus]|uniref:hypothetical protein n=1 Tax=Microbulbifer elongatus TaxID=86173 RepID=UPI001E354907|nr:hypothetical protein [Microbulbifer elongatus]
MRIIVLFLAVLSGTASASQEDFHHWQEITYKRLLPYSLAEVQLGLKISVSRDYSHKTTVEIEKIEVSGVKVEIPSHVLEEFPLISPSSLWLTTSHIEQDSTIADTAITIRFEYFSGSCKHKGSVSFLNYEFQSYSESAAIECS